MGGEKTTSTQTQRATPTAEETELNKILLGQAREADPLVRQTQKSGLELADLLLQGQNLPGFLSGLPGGISPEVTSGIVQQSLEDIRPGLQAAGLFDSGVRAELEARTAGDIRRASEEFNIGNRLNLLNLAIGGQAQVQQPVLAGAGTLSSNLRGLRSISGSSTQSGGANPYLTSFAKGAGGAAFGALTGGAGLLAGGFGGLAGLAGGASSGGLIGPRLASGAFNS